MAKLALALLAAPAVAFNFGGGGGAPARAAVDTTADIGVDPGPIEPTGPFWEDQEGLARRRAVEIKHGRIAMMAFIGHKQCVKSNVAALLRPRLKHDLYAVDAQA